MPATPSSEPMYDDDFSNPDTGFPRQDIADYKAGYEDGECHIQVFPVVSKPAMFLAMAKSTACVIVSTASEVRLQSPAGKVTY
ncbi:MAG: hypothetical protein MUO97_07670 [Dehalococcoidia bacterium]|nr:hypothetical protein [Dehalococcoidia bacterium]